MILLPILTRLTVSDYGLFPGERGSGFEWSFDSGVSLIAGVNGLGKTTILSILLRLLTGPYDLTGEGPPPKLNSVLPAQPVPLNATMLRFFSKRVADGAVGATAAMTADFGSRRVAIARSLADLTLLDLSVSGDPINLPGRKPEREAVYQNTARELFGLSSFVDVLLVLHHVVFFAEGRPGALWDENAQRQLLRALFLDGDTASGVAEYERKVQSADSRARGLSAAAYNHQRRLDEVRRREAVSPKVRSELEAEQRLLDAETSRRRELELRLSELDELRKARRLDYEKSKLDREEAETAVERLKYTALSSLFPTMEDAARLTIVRMLTDGACALCGADATVRRNELEQLLSNGVCPSCGADLQSQPNRVGVPIVVKPIRLKRARSRADLARTEESSNRDQLEEVIAEYDSSLTELQDLQGTISERSLRERRLIAELPPSSSEVRDLESALEATKRSQREEEAQLAVFSRQLRRLLLSGQDAIISRSDQLLKRFNTYVTQLLAEGAHLVRVAGSAKITQTKIDFAVPAFLPEMMSANQASYSRRMDSTDVSESQRELMDLAFRLALADIAAPRGSCAFIMETPEASLDGIAMNRVGLALHRFSQRRRNRLIVTSNLTNAGMISALFGGPARTKANVQARRRRTLNLLDIAAKSDAVARSRKAYNAMLTAALTGAIRRGR